jgi:predicted alpha/beta-fold hydrolase
MDFIHDTDYLQMEYEPPFWAKSRTLNTLITSQFRRVSLPMIPKVIAVNTDDGDLLWFDYYPSTQNDAPLAVLSHGLEGHSRKAYVLGMTKALLKFGFAVIAWNYRGCGGRDNRLLRFYHAGATEDLHRIVKEGAKKHSAIFLAGFSLGGNITANYLGSYRSLGPHTQVRGGAVISVPFDMLDSGLTLHHPRNWLYEQRFLNKLRNKVRRKLLSFPNLPNKEKLFQVMSLEEFDDYFTAPIHGFENARDYWTKTSSKNVLCKICVPMLAIQSQDDPFFSQGNQPANLPSSPTTTWITPRYGGHLGFTQKKSHETFPEEVVPKYFKSKMQY